jgi:hypothetical protein
MQLYAITATEGSHMTHSLSIAQSGKDICYGSHHILNFSKNQKQEINFLNYNAYKMQQNSYII